MNNNTHVLSILVENHAGVLNRVSGLFSRRTYNIESLSVGVTENPDISRMTVVTSTDNDTLVQIVNQVSKLIDVLDITILDTDNAVLREHVLVKVNASDMAGVMQAELTGAPNKINAFITLMEQYEIKDLVRTGLTGLLRG